VESSRQAAVIQLKSGPITVVREGLKVYPSRMISEEEAKEINAILKVWDPWSQSTTSHTQ
jgi:hypothetical protein